MTKEEEIKLLETEIRNIFNKDFISDDLVITANLLINKWKKLSKWKEDKTPFLDNSIKSKFYDKRRD